MYMYDKFNTRNQYRAIFWKTTVMKVPALPSDFSSCSSESVWIPGQCSHLCPPDIRITHNFHTKAGVQNNVCICHVTYLTKSDWLRGIVTDDVMTQYDLICLSRYSIHLLIKHITSFIYMSHSSLMFVFFIKEICIQTMVNLIIRQVHRHLWTITYYRLLIFVF